MLEYITSRCITHPSIFACANHFFYIEPTTRQLYAYGDNSYGQLGLGKSVKSTSRWMKVKIAEPISTISTCHTYTLILTCSGKVYGTGSNYEEQLREHEGSTRIYYHPIHILLPSPVKTIGLIGYYSTSIFIGYNNEVWKKGCYAYVDCENIPPTAISCNVDGVTFFITADGSGIFTTIKGHKPLPFLPIRITEKYVLSSDGDIYTCNGLQTESSSNEEDETAVGTNLSFIVKNGGELWRREGGKEIREPFPKKESCTIL